MMNNFVQNKPPHRIVSTQFAARCGGGVVAGGRVAACLRVYLNI